MDKFCCAMCGKVFGKGWSDEEAEAERAARFGDAYPQDQCDVVCDDCWNTLPEWMRSIAG